MNLYGEYGNIKAMARILKRNQVPFSADYLSVKDKVDLNQYDFIYVGSGTESNQIYVLEHLMTLKDDLKKYIDDGKVLLMTGNSFELLGKEIVDASGKTYKALNLFPFSTRLQDKTRTTADALFTMQDSKYPLVGFINKCSTIQGITTPLFQVKLGLGNEKNGTTEGIRVKNFFGTHLTGPVLIKNPFFLQHLAELVCVGEPDIAWNTDYMKYEKKSYNITLNELGKRLKK